MDAAQIKAFIDAMAASNLTDMQVDHEGWTLRLSRAGQSAAVGAGLALAAGLQGGPGVVPGGTTAPNPLKHQTAALAGTVYWRPAPSEPPFVQVGQTVRAGQVVCVIEAMKVFNHVHADRDGVVDALLVAAGDDVAAGQALLRWRD